MENYLDINGNKLFAILDSNNIVTDGWLAKNKEEAQADNPGFTVLEVTKENSPFTVNEKYIQKEKK